MMKQLGFLLIAGIGSGVSLSSQAAGFALIEQSASGLGNAYAGMAARADDASAQFFNPASLSWLPAGKQIVLGGSAILPSAKLKDSNASYTNNGTPIAGNNGGDAGSLELVPNFYFATDMRPDIKFGLGISVPYGLTSEYNNGWKGRYQALKSELISINVNPAFSFKPSEKWSIGGGISLQYAKAELTNAIDARVISSGLVTTDSYGKVSGDDLSWGFNLGTIYKPWEGTTLGVNYRSHIKHTLDGKARFKHASPLLATGLPNSDASADLSLPETVSLSLVQSLNDKFELLADVTWTNWSRFKELRVQFDSALPDTVTTTKWNDSYRVSLGGNYRYNDKLTLRAGVAYDQTPVPDRSHRTPRIPDADRTWLAIGASWKLDSSNTLDIGYAYLFLRDAVSNHSSEGALRHNIQGEFNSNVNILSAQWVYSL